MDAVYSERYRIPQHPVLSPVRGARLTVYYCTEVTRQLNCDSSQ